MVQVLAAHPALSSAGATAGHEQRDVGVSLVSSSMSSRDEHAQRMRDLAVKRSMVRAPRRGWSLSDYQGRSQRYDDDDDRYHHRQPAPHNQHHHNQRYLSQPDRQASIPENAIPQASDSRPSSPAYSIVSCSSSSSGSKLGSMVDTTRRPKIAPPRRSYSVTDKEPEPTHHHPGISSTIHLLDLPSELHYTLFDFLDPIDGACLGLAHPNLYAIHRRKNGSVPLCSRYSGPNDLEWAWRGAGPLLRRETRSSSSSPADLNTPRPGIKALDRLRVKGQVYCRKCGISRCELHRHLRDWMGSEYEYCEIRKIFGRRAHEAARPYCYLSSPKNPHRCGRHGGNGKKV
ncbi:hypothetical protein E4U41_004528 [Claviceps citrina]|nr:hypothetical protein E4U41_004528 [Claviceps citrina]